MFCEVSKDTPRLHLKVKRKWFPYYAYELVFLLSTFRSNTDRPVLGKGVIYLGGPTTTFSMKNWLQARCVSEKVTYDSRQIKVSYKGCRSSSTPTLEVRCLNKDFSKLLPKRYFFSTVTNLPSYPYNVPRNTSLHRRWPVTHSTDG